MPRRNRVDPWGDLHAVPERGLFTGNRGCVVDDRERVVRHHGSNLWIICRTSFRGWRVALARPGRWTPLFFLDDAVGLAAGHRPCATCRRDDYTAYRHGVEAASGVTASAAVLNARLQHERLTSGRGLERAADRRLHTMDATDVPDGAVVVDGDGTARLVHADRLWRFTFAGWTDPVAAGRRAGVTWRVLTPPTSVAALAHGFTPTLHPSADGQGWPNP